MSSSELKKLARVVLKDIEETAQGAIDDARSQLETQEGQILIINKSRFTKLLTKLIPSLSDASGNKAVREEIWNTFTTQLSSFQKNIDPVRLKELKKVKIIGQRRDDYIFYIQNYEVAKRAKGRLLKD